MIPGGYYIKARKIQESAIAHAPPHVREIWDLFLLRCSHSPRTNHRLQRGQLIISIKEIRESLCWYVGYRKMTYSKSNCENAMKWLRKAAMITTMKTTRGMIVTVYKYDHYQNPQNYDCRIESRNDSPNDAAVMPHDRQEGKEGKELKRERGTQKKVDDYPVKTDQQKSEDVDARATRFRKEVFEIGLKKYGKAMVAAFVDYWNETNTEKTVLRHEGEKYFDISRRLATWKSREKFTDSPGAASRPKPSKEVERIQKENYDDPKYQYKRSGNTNSIRDIVNNVGQV